MSIIIEGMDNTGKTVLASRLAAEFDLPVITREGASREPSDLLRQILTYLVLDPMVIYDRHPLLTEAVYGIILRDRDIFEPPITWGMYLDRLWENEPFIVYCRPPVEAITNFTDGQMSGVVEHAEELVGAYDRLRGELISRKFCMYEYNYLEPEDYLQLRNQLYQHLKYRRG